MNELNSFSPETIYKISEEWISNRDTNSIVQFLKESSKEHRNIVLSAISDNHYPINIPLYKLLLQLRKEEDYKLSIESIFLKCNISNAYE